MESRDRIRADHVVHMQAAARETLYDEITLPFVRKWNDLPARCIMAPIYMFGATGRCVYGWTVSASFIHESGCKNTYPR